MSKIDHPSHYNLPGRKECIEEMREIFGDDAVGVFCILNAYKYVYRAGCKEGSSEDQDKQKALWYTRYAQDAVPPKVLGLYSRCVYAMSEIVARERVEDGEH